MNTSLTTSPTASPIRFDHKVVLITGGGTGIGQETARRFHRLGARVVLNGRRADVLSQTAQEIDPSGERIAFVAGEISHSETSCHMVETALERFGGVDVLVNNAGIFKPTSFLDHTEDDLDSYLDIILKGSFFAAQACIPAMQKRGGGAIVNVGSIWAEHAVGATPSSAYSAAKAGVHALTRNLAIEFAPDRIRVNCIAPAVVETPVYDSLLSPEQLAGFGAFHPLGRNGQPGDVAAAIVFLAGEEASWITGAILPVDGGVLAGRS